MKLISHTFAKGLDGSAAFGRLRVETITRHQLNNGRHSAAFGRLRVETPISTTLRHRGVVSAAFGRLRVETLHISAKRLHYLFSRLRAAAC